MCRSGRNSTSVRMALVNAKQMFNGSKDLCSIWRDGNKNIEWRCMIAVRLWAVPARIKINFLYTLLLHCRCVHLDCKSQYYIFQVMQANLYRKSRGELMMEAFEHTAHSLSLMNHFVIFICAIAFKCHKSGASQLKSDFVSWHKRSIKQHHPSCCVFPRAVNRVKGGGIIGTLLFNFRRKYFI